MLLCIKYPLLRFIPGRRAHALVSVVGWGVKVGAVRAIVEVGVCVGVSQEGVGRGVEMLTLIFLQFSGDHSGFFLIDLKGLLKTVSHGDASLLNTLVKYLAARMRDKWWICVRDSEDS